MAEASSHALQMTEASSHTLRVHVQSAQTKGEHLRWSAGWCAFQRIVSTRVDSSQCELPLMLSHDSPETQAKCLQANVHEACTAVAQR